MRFWGGLTIAALFLASAFQAATALPLSAVPSAPKSDDAAVIPVVVFGQNARELPRTFALHHRLDPAEITRNHAASGLIQCGNAHGAGQLTLADDVITTAAHVFYDENGAPRAASCSFSVTVDGHENEVQIDLSSIVAGSKNPYDVDVAHDWAVARLAHPMSGIKPYAMASQADIHAQRPITFVARGHIDWGDAKKLSMQDCVMHDQIASGQEGTREFSFDCDTGDGASGGAVMFDRDFSRVGAILVGWVSNQPFKAVPFSPTHYNFAVTIEGAFRQAVFSAAGKMMVQK
jgi:hypothetical protein